MLSKIKELSDFDFEGEPPLLGNPVSVIEVVPCTILNFFDAGAVISDLEVAVMGVGFVPFESDGLGLVFRLYSFELFCELVLLLLHVLFEVSGFFVFFVDDLKLLFQFVHFLLKPSSELNGLLLLFF